MSDPTRMPPFDAYEALRSGCGLVELTAWSSVGVTGADRQTFLNNFCTNDVQRLVPGASCEAFFTDVKGKIVGHRQISCREEEMVVIGVPGQAPRLIDHLDRYVIRDDVQLRDTSGERAYLLLASERIADFGAGAADSRAGRSPAPIAWDLLGPRSTYLLETAPSHVASLMHWFVERGAVVCSAAAFETIRIEAGTPLFGVDFDERNLPQEVGRDEQAISFTKGCYLGQETVARIDALGHVNQRLVGVRYDGSDVPLPGTELTDAGQAVGRVTSATLSPRLRAPLALAMVRREHNSPGTRLQSPYGKCEVISLPLNI